MTTRQRKYLVLISVVVLVLIGLSIKKEVNETQKIDLTKKLSSLTIPFIENFGQIESQEVKYYAKTFGGTVFVKEDGEIVYSLFDKETKKGWVIEEKLLNAEINNVLGKEQAKVKVNYFQDKESRNNIPTYKKISLGEVYNGIEFELIAHGNNVEKIFIVKGKGNPEDINLKLDGASNIKINKSGELSIKTDLGDVNFSKPVAYQEINGKRKYVEVAYNLGQEKTYNFNVGNYNKNYPLIIDPLLASTFAGETGSSNQRNVKLAIDSSGNIFITGTTSTYRYPTTIGAYENTEYTSNSGSVFVSKFNSDLTELLASTFLGSKKTASSNGIAIDNSGNIYITGEVKSAYSYYEKFPITHELFEYDATSTNHVFISKLNNDLTELVSSTLISNTSNTSSSGLALDDLGNVYVAVSIDELSPSSLRSLEDVNPDYSFVYKLNEELTEMKESESIDGLVADLALDDSGNVFVAGDITLYEEVVEEVQYLKIEVADEPTGTIPKQEELTVLEPVKPKVVSDINSFITKFDNELENILATKSIEGEKGESVSSIAVDNAGRIYITGTTNSSDFPTTESAYSRDTNRSRVIFISKISNDLSDILASTFLGQGYPSTLAINEENNVYIAGYTGSSDFPVTLGALATAKNSDFDIFISKLNEDLSEVLVSSFLGGAKIDKATDLAIDNSGNLVVTGLTESPYFPTTSDAYNSLYSHSNSYNTFSSSSYYDVFLSKIDSDLSAPSLSVSPISLFFESGAYDNYSIKKELQVFNNSTYEIKIEGIKIEDKGSYKISKSFNQTNDCNTIYPNENCTITITFKKEEYGQSNKSAILKITSDDSENPEIEIPLEVGNIYIRGCDDVIRLPNGSYPDTSMLPMLPMFLLIFGLLIIRKAIN